MTDQKTKSATTIRIGGVVLIVEEGLKGRIRCAYKNNQGLNVLRGILEFLAKIVPCVRSDEESVRALTGGAGRQGGGSWRRNILRLTFDVFWGVTADW